MERHTFPEVPPRVEYSLTDKGRALLPLIEDMRAYGREWLGAACSGPPPASVPRRPTLAGANAGWAWSRYQPNARSTTAWRPNALQRQREQPRRQRRDQALQRQRQAERPPWPALKRA